MDNRQEKTLVVIPESVENLQLPNPELLEYYKNKQDRMFWIKGEVGENYEPGDDMFSLTELSKLIWQYNKEDKDIPVEQRKPIKLFIHSPGGDLDTTLAFVGMIGISKTPIWTINTCWAASAAGLILMAGHRRFTMPNTACLIHSGSGQLGGSYEQTAEQMKNYKYIVDTMRDFILSKTKIDQKLLKKNGQKDWYIYADEMLSLGIVDEIVTDLDILF